jgi:methionyl-tRNA formyltransferase
MNIAKFPLYNSKDPEFQTENGSNPIHGNKEKLSMKKQKYTRFIFIGTSEFAAIVLADLIKKKWLPLLVVTQPDKKTGRKQILTPSPVKKVAQKHNLPILQPLKIKTCKLEIEKYNPDLIIVAAYRQIIPREILNLSRKGCLNIHASLLPLYRGPSPIQKSILDGNKKTGATVIKMDEKIDHGPIISNIKYQISNIKITNEELSKELAILGAKLLIETIPKWIEGKIKPRIQDEKRATYTKIITKKDGLIAWQGKAIDIERQVRAHLPWPSAYTFWQGKHVKILEAGIYSTNFKLKPGQVFKTENNEIAVATSEKALIIKKLQLEGKKPILASEFLKGHSQIIGSILK